MSTDKVPSDLKDFAATLREEAFRVLQRFPFSADEVADELGVSILAMRPRISELHKDGRIKPIGMTKNVSGRPAKVWSVA